MPDYLFSKELIFIYFCTKQKEKKVQLLRKPLKEPNLLLRNVVEVVLTIVL